MGASLFEIAKPEHIEELLIDLGKSSIPTASEECGTGDIEGILLRPQTLAQLAATLNVTHCEDEIIGINQIDHRNRHFTPKLLTVLAEASPIEQHTVVFAKPLTDTLNDRGRKPSDKR